MHRSEPGNSGVNLKGRGPNWKRDGSQVETIFERPGESLSDPLLANGTAYVASSSGLHAVEQADGTVRWSLDGDDAVYPFGIANGQLFVGRGSENRVGPRPRYGVSILDG